MSVTVPVAAVNVSLIQPAPGTTEVYTAFHPAYVAPTSDVNQMSMLPPLDVKDGGRVLPLKVPIRGEDVVAPLYTLTRSHPASVLNEVNVRVMDPAHDGCMSF